MHASVAWVSVCVVRVCGNKCRHVLHSVHLFWAKGKKKKEEQPVRDPIVGECRAGAHLST